MEQTTDWRAAKARAEAARETAILTRLRAERASRKVKREWMQRHGLKPTRAQTVYRVETDAVDIPGWAEKYRIAELGTGDPPNDVIWVKQRDGGHQS